MKTCQRIFLLGGFSLLLCGSSMAVVVINEIDYDQAGPDVAGAPGDDNGTPYIGLSRLPDGADTNDNSADFTLRCITPGYGNSPQPADCLEPVPANSTSWGSMKSMYR